MKCYKTKLLMKKCKHCLEKSIANYIKDAIWRKKNRERINKIKTTWRTKNKEKIAKSNKKYRIKLKKQLRTK